MSLPSFVINGVSLTLIELPIEHESALVADKFTVHIASDLVARSDDVPDHHLIYETYKRLSEATLRLTYDQGATLRERFTLSNRDRVVLNLGAILIEFELSI